MIATNAQRILDIDLDFFVSPVLHWPDQQTRPANETHSVWSLDAATTFLTDQCKLRGRTPGFVTENHAELFPAWKRAVDAGLLVPPFHVTHLDAHADLGLGDSGYVYLMTSLLFESIEKRCAPIVGNNGLNDGNFLSFAIACRWIGDLAYVFGEGGGSDELPYVMKDFSPKADQVQLAAMTKTELEKLMHRVPASVSHFEPTVSYLSTRWESFNAPGPYDFVCLTRSPPYTPPVADGLFDALNERFIEPLDIEDI